MRHALVKLPLPGRVLCVEMHPQGHTAVAGEIAVASATANVGDTWDGKTFTSAAPAPAPAPTKADLLAYASDVQERSLAGVFSFDVGASGAPLVCTTRLDPRGRAAVDGLATWAIANASLAGATEPYSNADYSTATLTPAQALKLYTLARKIYSQSFATLNAVAAAIASGAITTRAAVEAPPAPIVAWPTSASSKP